MGDPAGIGPEICLRMLGSAEVLEFCVPVVFGDVSVLRACAEKLGWSMDASCLTWDEWGVSWRQVEQACVVDLGVIGMGAFSPGEINAATGLASYLYVERAIDAALLEQVHAVATGPLSKAALSKAGIHFPGHTEIFASRTKAPRSCMMQYSEEITCAFVTVHVGYHEVPALLTTQRIFDVIELSAQALRRIRGREPRMVVCGLNPHAGEGGLFGDCEEERIIAPAVAAARAQGMEVEGPLPPDAAFLPWRRKSTDAFICMYHDQGHIPVKALAFDSAVNTTLGLPMIRTSVDHGTALDIAWQGKAHTGSFLAAIRLAARLFAN